MNEYGWSCEWIVWYSFPVPPCHLFLILIALPLHPQWIASNVTNYKQASPHVIFFPNVHLVLARMFLLAGGILSLAVRCMWFSSFPFLSYQNLKPLLVIARKRRPSQVNQPRALCIRSARQCLPYRAAVLFHPGSALRGSYQMRRLQLKVLSPAYLNAALNIASTSKWAVSVPANLHPSATHAFLSLITAKRFRAQIFSGCWWRCDVKLRPSLNISVFI